MGSPQISNSEQVGPIQRGEVAGPETPAGTMSVIPDAKEAGGSASQTARHYQFLYPLVWFGLILILLALLILKRTTKTSF